MKKNTNIAVVVVLILAALAWGTASMRKGDGDGDATGTPKASTQATPKGATNETTAVAGNYMCAGGKTFTLVLKSDGTARATGANSSNVVLRRSSLGIWISGDSKVGVRETGDYTILVENDVTTRDKCYLR